MLVPMLLQSDTKNAAMSFRDDLQISFVPQSCMGSSTPTFTRASVKTVVEGVDGNVVSLLSGEWPSTGAGREYSVVNTTSEDWTNAAWTKTIGTVAATALTSTGANQTVLQSYTAASANWVMRVEMSRSGGTGNIQLTLDGGTTWTTVTLTGAVKVFSLAQTAVTNPQYGIRIVASGDAIYASKIAVYTTSGKSNVNPPEYVSVGVTGAPAYHGAGVDGVKLFGTLNGNTVAANVVTEATGAKLATGSSNWAQLPGVSGSTFTSPTKSITGNATLNLEYALSDFTPGSDTVLASKTSGNNGFTVTLLTTGKFRLIVGDGASLTNVDVATAPTWNDGTRHILSIVWQDGVGATFSYDGAQSGSQVAAAKTLTNAAVSLTVGPQATISGKLYSASITNSASTTYYKFNPNDYANGGSWVSATGEWWYVNGSASVFGPGGTWTNLAKYSQAISNWNISQASVTDNQIVAPDGSTTASKLAATGNSGLVYLDQGSIGAATLAWRFNIKIGSGATEGNNYVLRNSTTATNVETIAVNLATGSVTASNFGATSKDVGNGWWQITSIITSGVSAGNDMITYMAMTGGTSNGQYSYMWGNQLYAASAAPSYIPTTSGAITVSSVQAPWDAKGPLGYLAEQASDQRVTPTAAIRDMTDASWVKVGITAALNAVGDDGIANSATTLTAAGAVTNTILQTLVAAASSRTYSIKLKRGVGTGTIKLTQDGGVTLSADMSALLNTNTFTTVQWNANVLNAAFGLVMGAQNDTVIADMNLFEPGAIATSRILTAGATRNADVDQYVSALNWNAAAFTAAGEVTWPIIPPTGNYWLIGTYVDANNATGVLWDGTNLIGRVRISGTSHDATKAFAPVAGTTYKWAMTHDAAGTQIYVNGVAGTADATGTTAQIATNLQICSDGNGGNQPYANVRLGRIYSQALTAGQIGNLP